MRSDLQLGLHVQSFVLQEYKGEWTEVRITVMEVAEC